MFECAAGVRVREMGELDGSEGPAEGLRICAWGAVGVTISVWGWPLGSLGSCADTKSVGDRKGSVR